MERAVVIVNPAAGSGRTARLWPSLADQLRATGLDFDVAFTRARGDGVTLARRAGEDGCPLVVAVGGDGSVNEVVNGLADLPVPPTLGVLATGRGRDVCRNLGIERDPRRALARLAAGRDSMVDLGRVDWMGGRRWFLTAAGAGFDAEVARRAATRGGFGTIPYLLAILGALAGHRPVPATVTLDDGSWSGRATAVVVANGAWYGGGMRIAPPATPTDGVLDLIVLGDVGRFELLRWLPAVYRGRHLDHPRVVARRTRRAAVEAARPLPVHVDGEVVGVTPVVVTVRPGALALRR